MTPTWGQNQRRYPHLSSGLGALRQRAGHQKNQPQYQGQWRLLDPSLFPDILMQLLKGVHLILERLRLCGTPKVPLVKPARLPLRERGGLMDKGVCAAGQLIICVRESSLTMFSK